MQPETDTSETATIDDKRGWMSCAALASYLLGRTYWVWTPHGLYKLLLREPGVCRVAVSALVGLDEAQLADASSAIAACEQGCAPGAPERRRGHQSRSAWTATGTSCQDRTDQTCGTAQGAGDKS